MLPDTIRAVLQQHSIPVHTLEGMNLINDILYAVIRDNVTIPRALTLQQVHAQELVDALYPICFVQGYEHIVDEVLHFAVRYLIEHYTVLKR